MEDQMERALLCASTVAGVVSSAYLLQACSSAPPRLLKRQLFHQALATLPIVAAKSVLLAWAAVPNIEHDCAYDPKGQAVVEVHRWLAHVCFFATWLIDLHIAATIAAASLHKPAVLRWLGRWLPLVWVLAAAYGIRAEIEALVEGDEVSIIDDDPIGAAMVLILFLSTIVLYLVALVMVWRSHSPNSVIIRTRRRAMVYPLIFIVTVFPTVLRYLQLENFAICARPWGALGLTGEHLTVTLNAFTFCMTSGSRMGEQRQVELEKTNQPDGARFVGFEGEGEIVEIEDSGSFRTPNQWMRRGLSLDFEVSVAEGEGISWGDEAGWREFAY